MDLTIRDFRDAVDELGCNQTAAAILVLADVISKSNLANIHGLELGHQFGCALKECFPTSFDVSLDFDSAAALQNAAEALNDLAEAAKTMATGGLR
jgi:hypothetical protein